MFLISLSLRHLAFKESLILVILHPPPRHSKCLFFFALHTHVLLHTSFAHYVQISSGFSKIHALIKMFIEIILGVRTLLGHFGELVGATFHKVFLIKRLSLGVLAESHVILRNRGAFDTAAIHAQHAIYVRVDVVACLLWSQTCRQERDGARTTSS